MTLPEISDIVHVRQRTYLVEDVVRDSEGSHTLVELSCVDDDAAGEFLQVVWELEIDARVVTDKGWTTIGSCNSQARFDPPRVFSAYLNALKWGCVTATRNDIFQSPFRAGIRVHPYQLEPLRKALNLPRVNLFIADDVGLGKTIEAALIAHELILRKRVNYVVVACPPAVQEQWREELLERFGMTFEVINRDFLVRIRSEQGYQVNPWGSHSRFIVSHKLLIDEEYKSLLRDFFGPLKYQSLLILDEAHHAAPASSSKHAIDSQFTRSIREIASRFEHKLFLSATPHNGHSNSFSALLEILDPIRFVRGVPALNKKSKSEVLVRRLKQDLKATGLASGFPKRSVVQIDIDGLGTDSPELRLSELLSEYRNLRFAQGRQQPNAKLSAIEIVLLGLQQRLLSSIEAFHRTLERHSKSVQSAADRATSAKSTGPTSAEIKTFIDGPDAPSETDDFVPEADGSDDDQLTATLTADFLRSESTKDDSVKIESFSKLLLEMQQIATKARFENCSKIEKLIDWIEVHQCSAIRSTAVAPESRRWTEKKLIVFTQYDDTLRYLKRTLERYILPTDSGELRIATYTGRTQKDERDELKHAFNSAPDEHPLRILLATDAAREGLNLQAHCHHLFHFDIPWNPSRLEQRNGRIDRMLQPKPEVFCYYFFYKQRTEDPVLKAMIDKTQNVLRELGSMSPVIETKLLKLFEKGIAKGNVKYMEQQIAGLSTAEERSKVILEELEDARHDELNKQIVTLRKALQLSKDWLDFDANDLIQSMNCALGILGVEGLVPAMRTGENSAAPVYRFPVGNDYVKRDVTWIADIDSLRRPRKTSERLWDWRKSAPIRDIVFSDPGTYADQSVQFHLQQRIVQRLLSRFRSQGFQNHDISRAAIVACSDPVPRVILIGRIAIYGQGAARLHEEIIYATAEYNDGENLRLLKGASEAKCIDLLKESLRSEKSEVPTDAASRVLRKVKENVTKLRKQLESKFEVVSERAAQALIKRGEQEAADLERIISQQVEQIDRDLRNIQASADKYLFLDEEQRQIELDRRHKHERLNQLAEELKTEPQKIKEMYSIKTRRFWPVGIVYLWPMSG
jgi:superfamily II DNA or RNA helicase